MSQNQTTRYLKYAIGEIILVVIGILIALQINNWNETRKTVKVEIQMLKNMRNSLISDIENQLKPNLQQLELDMHNISDIKYFMSVSQVYHDSMNIKFNTLMYSKNNAYEVTSYKALENKGLQIIQNPELKTSILKLYNMSYPNLQYVIENFTSNLITFYRPNMRQLFLFLDNNKEKGYTPENYEALTQNRDFRNNLVTCAENCKNLYNATNTVKLEVEALIKMIDKELSQRD